MRAPTPAVCRADLGPDLRKMFPQVIPQVPGQVCRLPEAGTPQSEEVPGAGERAPHAAPHPHPPAPTRVIYTRFHHLVAHT